MSDESSPHGASTAIPTQKDVARLAGVSPVTVSRALSGGSNVAPELHRRVIEAARQLHYLPNENARGLRPGQQSNLIGVAITNLSNPFYGKFAVGVEEVAREKGRFILFGSTEESATRERELVSNFLGRRVEGLIVIPASEPAPRQWVRRLGPVPLVLAAREVEGVDTDRVLMDDAAMAQRATTDLLRRGHTRIAFLGNIDQVSAHRALYEEFRRVMGEAGVAVDPILVRSVTDEVVDGAARVDGFLRLPNPPTALIVATNRIAVGVLQVYGRRLDAGAAGLHLPALSMFGELELADLLRVRVRAYASDPREFGRTAAQTLFDRLEGRVDEPSRRLVVPLA